MRSHDSTHPTAQPQLQEGQEDCVYSSVAPSLKPASEEDRVCSETPDSQLQLQLLQSRGQNDEAELSSEVAPPAAQKLALMIAGMEVAGGDGGSGGGGGRSSFSAIGGFFKRLSTRFLP